MGKAFRCVVCAKKVEPGLAAHPSCSRTCGNAKCQAIYYKQCSTQIDRRRQRSRIKQLQLQGVDMVTLRYIPLQSPPFTPPLPYTI